MPEMTTTQKCRACIDTGTLGPEGECTDPAHQVAPEIGQPEPDIDRARRALRAFIEHLDAAPSATVLDALNSALLAYDPPPPEPPTDLRDAIARTAGLAIAQCHDDGPLTWHPCGQCQGTPCACSGEPFSVVVADAVLPVVQAHVAAEVESYRLALATLVEGLSPDQRCACEDCQVEQVEIERVWTFARDVLLDGKLDVPARLRAEGSADALAAVADVEQHRPGNPEVRAGWVGACAALRAELNSMAGGVH